jgi:hypothetical protein
MATAEQLAPSPAILYVDISALLKLLVREAESAAIERELLTWRELATSVIAEVELPRAREERAGAARLDRPTPHARHPVPSLDDEAATVLPIARAHGPSVPRTSDNGRP